MELLFVNDIPVQITKDTKVLDTWEQYSHFLRQGLQHINPTQLDGTLLVQIPQQELYTLLQLLQQEPLVHVQGITVLVEDHPSMKELIQGDFKLVKAAGGVVSKGDQILLIHRRNRWDLPKGKRNKREKSAAAAVREVEEECSIKVKLLSKICTTWHTYTRKDTCILKKTAWYAMTCLDDTYMRPQMEEGIEQVVWMNEQEVHAALRSTYQSIQYIYQAYCKYYKEVVQTSFVTDHTLLAMSS